MLTNAQRLLVCFLAMTVRVCYSCPTLTFVVPSPHSTWATDRTMVTDPTSHAQLPAGTSVWRTTSCSLTPVLRVASSLRGTLLNNNVVDRKDNKNLYEILGASPTASRVELKKRYKEMAKLSHPDAQIAKAAAGSSSDDKNNRKVDLDELEFGEIAAAWKVLGDEKTRKRYDRELQYKEWSQHASRFTDEKLEKAAPAMAKIMDTVVVPFIHSAAATTFALSKIGEAAFTEVFAKGMKVGREMGRALGSPERNMGFDAGAAYPPIILACILMLPN